MMAQHVNLLPSLLTLPQLLRQPGQLTGRVVEAEEEEEILSGTEVGVEGDQSEAGLDQGGVEPISPECLQVARTDMLGPGQVGHSIVEPGPGHWTVLLTCCGEHVHWHRLVVTQG